jgi:hypothetical protein
MPPSLLSPSAKAPANLTTYSISHIAQRHSSLLTSIGAGQVTSLFPGQVTDLSTAQAGNSSSTSTRLTGSAADPGFDISSKKT